MGLPMGLPMGLQLIGAPRGDLALLQLAARYEQLAADVLARRPLTPARHNTAQPARLVVPAQAGTQ